MRKACHRRRFHLGLHPVRLALLGAPVPAADWQTIRVRELLALDALAAGTGEPADVRQLQAGVETAVGLASVGYGADTLHELQAARQALQRIAGQPAGAMRADLDDLAALREALAVADAQRDVVPRRDHERAAVQAMKLIERRL
jgi:hypothetical protein